MSKILDQLLRLKRAENGEFTIVSGLTREEFCKIVRGDRSSDV